MKKSLLALAVLSAFAGAASAQSSVTMYGRVDLSIGRQSGSDEDYLGNGSQNRLGLRGVEDLGNGLSAIFNIESGFNGDTGQIADSNRFWRRRSIVGLQGGFGSVTLGRELTTSYSMVYVAFDPWGNDTVVAAPTAVASVPSLALPGSGGLTRNLGGTGGLTRLGFAFDRQDNSLTYKYSLAGFTVSGQASERTDPGLTLPSTGTGTVAPGTTGPVATPGGAIDNFQKRPWNVAAQYAGGPITAGVSYERTGFDITAREKIAAADAYYNFGLAKVGGYYARGTSRFGEARMSYAGTVVAPLGSGELRAILGRVRQDDGDGWYSANTLGAVGYHYSLSKRTTVYADYVRNTGSTLNDTSKNGYDFGLKHNF